LNERIELLILKNELSNLHIETELPQGIQRILLLSCVTFINDHSQPFTHLNPNTHITSFQQTSIAKEWEIIYVSPKNINFKIKSIFFDKKYVIIKIAITDPISNIKTNYSTIAP